MATPNHFYMGNGHWPVVVIDDFYHNPAELLESAGNLSSFKPYENDFYPGVKKAADNEQCANNFARYDEALSGVFGELERLQKSTYAIANRAPTDLLPIQRVPHYDTNDTQQLALVHYLCAANFGGTAFYRHRSTNIERISGENEKTFQQALGREATTHGLPSAAYIDGDTELFKQIGMVEAKFNRAVIYPASLLHSGSISWHHPSNQTGELDLTQMRLTITAQTLSTAR